MQNLTAMRKLEKHRTLFIVSDQNRQSLSSIIDTLQFDDIISNTPWALECLESTRDQLNACKGQLSHLSLIEWQQHTDFTEISSNIRRVISKNIAPPILTRAWIKFYEIINSFQLFDQDKLTNEQVRALFLCEAPGGFINATNHYLRLNYPNLTFEWLANTLNPYYELVNFDASVLDDRFIQQLPTFRNWIFGRSNRGDILETDFIEQLETTVRQRYQLREDEDAAIFDFVTGDGAFDCFDSLDRQEEKVFPLIYREATIGMHFLKNSGSLVIKFFTFFSTETISLIYFLEQCFHKVVVFKPVASKHGNSEIYVVANRFNRDCYLRFRSASIDLAKIPPEKFIVNKNLLTKDAFLDRMAKFSEEQANRQMDVIDYNLWLYEQGLDDNFKRHLTRQKYHVATMWLRLCNLEQINLNDHLLKMNHFVNADKRYANYLVPLLETWNESKRNSAAFTLQLIEIIDKFEFASPNNKPFVKASLSDVTKYVNYVYGRPYSCINNSKFCCTYLLKSFTIVLSYLQQQQQQNEVMSQFLKEKNEDISRLPCYLQTIFNSKAIQFQPVFSSHSLNFANLLQKSVDISKDQNELETNEIVLIHCLDLHHLTSCLTSNDFILCRQLRQQVGELIKTSQIQLGHSLIVRVKGFLSRLLLGLLYLLVKLFESYSVELRHFPQEYSSKESSPASLVIVLKDFQGKHEKIVDIFTEEAEDRWNETLLEILPVQLLITDRQFYDNVLNANCIAVAWKLRQILAVLKKHEQPPNSSLDCS